MKKIVLALLMMSLSMTTVAAAETATATNAENPNTSPWIPVAADEQVLTMRDVPLDLMHREPEKYLGTVFEDRFKFYHIYRDKEDVDPAKSRQTIIGETHFTARPVQQSVHVIRIRITPAQDEWMLEQGHPASGRGQGHGCASRALPPAGRLPSTCWRSRRPSGRGACAARANSGGPSCQPIREPPC